MRISSGRARRIRRRFLPAHVQRDIRDHELLVALLERELSVDSDCLDVGAHDGTVLRELLRIAPGGRHIAWEPLPEFAARLRTEFPSVEIRQVALSDSAGEREFAHVVDEPGWSGFVARPNPKGGPVEMLPVRTERLDDLELSPRLIKIDVEGAEEEVLRGALETLRRSHPWIVFEHGRGSADHYGTTPEALHDLLGNAGYEIFGLDGAGPYTPERLAAYFDSGERVNFAARFLR